MIPTHASYLADVARAAHQTGKDLTLEEVAAVIEAVNTLGAADDTLARTGNTARDQEMYAAGRAVGEENAKHNAAIRGGVPAGCKLVPIEPTDEMEAAAEDDYEQRGETFPDWKAKYRAMLAAAPASPVSTVEDAGAQKEAVMDAIADALGNAYDCMRVWSAWSVGTMSEDDFRLVADDAGRLGELADAAIAATSPAPAAGDAQDAARLNWLEQHDGRFFNKDRISSIVGVGFLVAGDPEGVRHQTVRSAIDAAIAAQRQGDA